MPVKVNNLKVAALIDSGSSINIISKQFYDSILDSCKSQIQSPVYEKILLANNQSVGVIGKSSVKMHVPQEKHWIPSYIVIKLFTSGNFRYGLFNFKEDCIGLFLLLQIPKFHLG